MDAAGLRVEDDPEPTQGLTTRSSSSSNPSARTRILPSIYPSALLSQLTANAKEADNAWPIFQALWQELTLEGHGRPPILFCLDGLSHIMKVSDYRSPAFELIHSHDLALVKLFNDCLSGAQNMLP